MGIKSLGRVPDDLAVTQAQIAGRTVVEFCKGPAAQAIGHLWRESEEVLQADSSIVTSERARGGGGTGFHSDYNPRRLARLLKGCKAISEYWSKR